MLIKTEEVQAQHKKLDPKEKHKAELKAYCDYHLSQATLMDDKDLSPTNAERQLGKLMWPHELEVRLQKLIPNLHFLHNPTNTRMKAMYLLVPGQTDEYLLAYNNMPMPEYSIFSFKEEEYWDGTEHINRADFPKGELQANGEFKYDGPRPGFKRIKRPWNEMTRGWRTVLVKLVQRGLLSPVTAESIFGTSDRASWNAHIGNNKSVTPF